MIRVISSTQEGNNRVIKLTQEKFNTNPTKVDTKSQWMIPLTFCSSSNPKETIHTTLMEGKDMTVTIPNVGQNEWVKVFFKTFIGTICKNFYVLYHICKFKFLNNYYILAQPRNCWILPSSVSGRNFATILTCH